MIINPVMKMQHNPVAHPISCLSVRTSTSLAKVTIARVQILDLLGVQQGQQVQGVPLSQTSPKREMKQF